MMRNIKVLIILELILIICLGAVAMAGDIVGKVTATKKKYLADAVVYVDSVQGDFKPPEKHPVMNQKNLVFSPHVMPILVGTTVDFLNSDDVAHNVFSPDKSADKFNLGTWPTGQIRSHTFEKRCDQVCEAAVLCNVHPEMEAFIVMMQNPYYSITDEDGNFTIRNVPSGSHTIKVWHPKLKAEVVKADVPDTGSVSLEIPLKR